MTEPDPMRILDAALDEYGVVDPNLRRTAHELFQRALDAKAAEEVDVDELLEPFRGKPAS